jgi:AraC-like DNA-binding protein
VESLELYPGELVWFTRSRSAEGLEVLHARNSPRLWKIWHDTYTLCLTYRGNGSRCGASWRYRNRDLTIGPREVMLMEPGEVHVTQRIEGDIADFDAFFLKPSLVDEIGRELGLHGPFHLNEARSDDPQLCIALADLARGLDRDDDESLAHQERLGHVLRLLLGRYAEKRAAMPPALSKVQVTRVRDFFEAHYAESFDLDHVALACRVSKSSICHTLPRCLGVTPRELQTIFRVVRAKELLALGVAASEVASRTGFADQAQLTRHFKRHWRVTPARYARMVGAR